MFKHQKLLSIGLEAPLPLVNNKREPFIPEPFRPGDFPPRWDASRRPSSWFRFADHLTMFPVLAFVGMVLVFGFFLNQLFKRKTRPKRKKPRLKKLQPILVNAGNAGVKVPGV